MLDVILAPINWNEVGAIATILGLILPYALSYLKKNQVTRATLLNSI